MATRPDAPQAAAERRDSVPEPDLECAARLFATLRSETADRLGVTRAAYGEGEQFAHDLVAAEAAKCGLEKRIDAAGNLYLRLPGHGHTGRSILVGSHLDSVPMGGNFDGAAGVLAALAVAIAWQRAGFSLSDDLVVVALRAEESNWFPFSYIGSKTAFGLLPSEALDIRRSDTGRSLASHMSDLGLRPDEVRAGVPQIRPQDISAYIELHIEQGPVLIEADQPAAIVEGIRGSFRYRHIRVLGEYAHSGAVPRAYRHDAVVAAAGLVTRLHQEWLRLEAAGHDLTLTVGQFHTDAEQHAFSKIAGQVNLSLDVRSHDQATLDLVHELARDHVDEVAAAHGVTIETGPLTGSTPALMDRRLIDTFLGAMGDAGLKRFHMPSGAGHDAATFASAGVPSLMLFVRNRNGSHNPDEAMEMNDFAAGTRLLAHGLARIG